MQQALPTQHDARSDHDIFTGPGWNVGFRRAFTENKSERVWLKDMWERSQSLAAQQGFHLPTFEEFETNGMYRLPEEPRVRDWMANIRENPERSPLETPSGKLELYSANNC
jgi:biotin/methionine sulfoxide reductase